MGHGTPVLVKSVTTPPASTPCRGACADRRGPLCRRLVRSVRHAARVPHLRCSRITWSSMIQILPCDVTADARLYEAKRTGRNRVSARLTDRQGPNIDGSHPRIAGDPWRQRLPSSRSQPCIGPVDAPACAAMTPASLRLDVWASAATMPRIRPSSRASPPTAGNRQGSGRPTHAAAATPSSD